MVDRRPLLTTPELSIYLQKPEKTLRQWRYLGTGPTWVKVGHDVRYRWEDVDRWLGEQSRAAA